jgi:hypothetical protein
MSRERSVVKEAGIGRNNGSVVAVAAQSGLGVARSLYGAF